MVSSKMRFFILSATFLCSTYAIKCYTKACPPLVKCIPSQSDALDCSIAVAHSNLPNPTQCYSWSGKPGTAFGCSVDGNPCEKFGISNGKCKDVSELRVCCCGTDLCNSKVNPETSVTTKSPSTPTNDAPTQGPQPDASTKSADSVFFTESVISVLLIAVFQ